MPFISNVGALAACDAIVDGYDVGSTDANADLSVYNGTPPADADTALSGNTLLAKVELANPSFGSAADVSPGGRATLLGVPLSDTAIDATGTVSFGRIFNRNNSCRWQGTVGTSATDIIVNSTALQINAAFTITSMTQTMPES